MTVCAEAIPRSTPTARAGELTAVLEAVAVPPLRRIVAASATLDEPRARSWLRLGAEC
ncbi:MAG TPA: hypothetical protein VG184_02450 [Acidimicrobiales bacterium]|nr:hypothetical protein [Acidimicrobiales bacterium]